MSRFSSFFLCLAPLLAACAGDTFFVASGDAVLPVELRGNLFSRSAWQHFTLAQLDRRGMLSEAEAERVRDQGLFLRQRVAHAESVRGESLRTVLNQTSPLSCGTFEARERIMRETGRDPTIWHARVPRSRQNEDQDELEALGVAKSFKKPTIGAVRVGAGR